MERRDFIRRWGRIVLLGGIAGTAGYLAFSGRVSGDAVCAAPGRCGSCSQYTSCKDSKRQNPENHGK